MVTSSSPWKSSCRRQREGRWRWTRDRTGQERARARTAPTTTTKMRRCRPSSARRAFRRPTQAPPARHRPQSGPRLRCGRRARAALPPHVGSLRGLMSPPACPRQAPSMPEASAEVLASLQRVFGLGAKPKDAADGLHRVVKERMHSWAYSADRGLPYLLNCYKRVLAASSEARCVSALGGGGQGGCGRGTWRGGAGEGGGKGQCRARACRRCVGSRRRGA